MKYLSQFTNAIHSLNKVQVTFNAKKYGGLKITRLCAPMDYSLSKIYKDKEERYHFWDFQGTGKTHNLSLLESEIIEIKPIEDKFKPESFVSWTTNWSIKRDWGSFS
jgi:hypothetical protein